MQYLPFAFYPPPDGIPQSLDCCGNSHVSQERTEGFEIITRIVGARYQPQSKRGIQNPIIGLKRRVASVHVLHQERRASQRNFHWVFQRGRWKANLREVGGGNHQRDARWSRATPTSNFSI